MTNNYLWEFLIVLNNFNPKRYEKYILEIISNHNNKANEIMFWLIIIGLLIILFQLICLYYFMDKINILIDKYKKLKKGIEIVATRTGCIEDIKATEKLIKSNMAKNSCNINFLKDLAN